MGPARLIPVREGARMNKTPSLMRPLEQNCAVCYDTTFPNGRFTCNQCRGVLYCSEQCWSENIETGHRQLCSRYCSEDRNRPGGARQYARAFFFPMHESRP